MPWFKPKSLLDTIFEGSLLLKGLSAASEMVGALLLIFVPSGAAMSFVDFVTQRELFEDPHDFIANFLISGASSLWGGQHIFAIIFLLSHAAVKFVIVFGLLRNLRWAYPFSFITLALMIAYQVYDMAVRFSYGMLILTLFDLFIMWLIWRESKKLPPRDGAEVAA